MNTLPRGYILETAFTQEEVERAIALEIKLGIRNSPCAFMGDGKNDYKPVSLRIVRGKDQRYVDFP